MASRRRVERGRAIYREPSADHLISRGGKRQLESQYTSELDLQSGRHHNGREFFAQTFFQRPDQGASDGRIVFAAHAVADMAGAQLAHDRRQGFQVAQTRDSGAVVMTHAGSVAWNAHRRRWVMIVCQTFGTSFLGETWYAEADTPVGPWAYAVKVVTHDRYMLDRVSSIVLGLDGQGGAERFADYSQWETWQAEREQASQINTRGTSPAATTSATTSKNICAPSQKSPKSTIYTSGL